MLEYAREELGRGNVRRVAEKVWSSLAPAVEAYAAWKDGRRLESRGDLWRYKYAVAGGKGEWVRAAERPPGEPAALHTCLYEGWCTRRGVEDTLAGAESLADEAWKRVKPAILGSRYYTRSMGVAA